MNSIINSMFLRNIFIPVRFIFNKILSYFNIFILYRYGGSLGDKVCMTGYVRLLHQQENFKIWVLTNNSDIFLHNPKISHVFDIKDVCYPLQRIVKLILSQLTGGQIERFVFEDNMNGYKWSEYLRNSLIDKHMIELHSKHFRKKIVYSQFKNEMLFSCGEIRRFKKKFNMPDEYALIHSQSKVDVTPNKQWDVQKFQDIVNHFDGVNWIQIGMDKDEELDYCKDLRGKTNFRELAFIISRSRFVVSTEGLYNHIASSFDCMSFVIYTGLSNPSLTMYKNTIPIKISSQDMPSCFPCYLDSNCENPSGRECSMYLSSKDAINIIELSCEASIQGQKV